MSTCSSFRDDLALRAGGDLPAGPALSAVESHLDACSACRNLAAALEGDRAFVAAAAVQPEADLAATSLVAPVLARAAAEAVANGVYRSAIAPSRRDFGLPEFARLAAAAAVLGVGVLLGLSMLVHEPAGERTASGQAPGRLEPSLPPAGPVAAPAAEPVAITARAAEAPVSAPRASSPDERANQDFRPVRVHRAGGAAVELEWESDGREKARGDEANAYRVLASASPSDFSGARPVLVAASRLVAGSDLPSHRTSDRSITYFRVE